MLCHMCMQQQNLLYLTTIADYNVFLIVVKNSRFRIKLKKSKGGRKLLTMTVHTEVAVTFKQMH